MRKSSRHSNGDATAPRGWPLALLKSVVIAASGLVAVGVAAAVVISHTTAGREFALARALEWLRPSLNGTLRVGSMGPGGLLAGATLYDIELGDSLGRPVLVADSMRARYSVAQLFGGPPAIADLHIWSPVVHLEPEPGHPVTLAGLLAGTGMEAPEDAAVPPPDETGSPLFRIRGARVHGGTVIMRDAAGTEERVEGIEADFARIDIGPGGEVDLAAEMNDVALSYPMGPAGRLELSGLRGEVDVGADDIVVRADRFRLPGSEGSGRMEVGMSDDPWLTVFDLDLSRLSLANLVWLDERLDSGVARGGLRVAVNGNDVHVDVAEAEVEVNSGSFALSGGVSITDRVRFRGLRVRPRMLATAEIERWLPDTPPVAGAVSGDIRFEGAPGRLRVSGGLTLFDGTSRTIRARATGGGTVLGVRSFEGMEIEVAELDYTLLKFFAPGVPWGGEGDLVLRADGELGTGMAVRIAANHSLGPGPGNTVMVTGTVYGDTTISVIEVDATMSPLSLSTIRRRWPDFPMTGPVSGSLSVNGSLAQLGFAAELETPAGPLFAKGRINGHDLAAGYQLTVWGEDFQLARLLGGLPDSTVVSGRAHVSGRGLDLESVRGALALTARASRIGPLRVDTAAVSVWVDDDGLLHVTSLYTEAGGIVVEGQSGTLGVASGASGSGVSLSVSSPSIRSLRPVFMSGNLVAWDELSPIDRERLEFGGADPDTFPTVEEVRFGGTVDGRIRLEGGLRDLRAEAAIALGDLEYGLSAARAVNVRVAATGLSLVGASPAAASPATIVLEGEIDGDSVVVAGREFRSGRLDGRVGLGEGGRLRAVTRRSPREIYEAQAVVSLDDGGGRIDLDRLTMVFPDRRWNLQGPASMEWSPDSVVVNDFGLIRPGTAGLRLFADGRLVRGRGESDFELRLADLDLSVVSRVLQLDQPLTGMVSAVLSGSGTAANPVWRGSLRVDGAVNPTLRFDSVVATGDYADGTLASRVETWSGDRRSLRFDGAVPMDLRLTTVDDRIPDEPRRIEIEADAFPAAMVLPALTDLEDVGGTVSGVVTIAGTSSAPRPGGNLRLDNASGYLEALGIRLSSAYVDARVSPDGIIALEGTARSGGGTMQVRGTADIGQAGILPLDLAFWPREFEVVDRPDMVVAVSGDSITLTGSFSYPLIEGQVEVNDGTVLLEEFQRSAERIDFYDPALFSAATVQIGSGDGEGEVAAALRAPNPFLRNLRVLVDLHVGPGNWLRSREMNVETAGDLTVTFDRQRGELIVQGDIEVVRGTYSLGPRTFRMTDGSFRFVGTPGFNPGISVTAENRLRTREGEPLVITADISGTLLTPHLSLASDAEYAISEADLYGYILFGRPTSALIGEGGAASVGVGRDLLVGQFVNQVGYLLAQELDVDHLSVSQADQSQANAAFGASSLQVELGWYLVENVFFTGVYQRGFCADPTLAVGSGGVRVEVEMPKNVTLEGFVEGRCTRQRYRGLGDLSLELARIWGLQIFREWGY